jgi:predicted RNA-binding Zn ribbon-like protein
MDLERFDLGAGVLCLDFANTVNMHTSDHPEDVLSDYFDLIDWGEAVKILSSPQAEQLRQKTANQSDKAANAFARAVEVREAIYRIFAAYSEQERINPDDLAILNNALSEALPHLQIFSSPPGFTWDWQVHSDNPDQVLWAVARSAGELLTSDRLDRVRQCADDHGCDYLFVDNSRNRSRRWCSMESCGNRAKARRHYKRQQEA